MGEREISIPPGAREAFSVLDRYLHPSPVLIIISGPSGVGKDAVIKRMCELDYPLHFLVTATDRRPRPGEVDGVDYYFISTADFEAMIARDDLLEYALVYGQYKGVPKAHARRALAAGTDVVMRVDVQGAAAISRLWPQVVTIFLVPPSLDVLVERLRRRAGDTTEQVQQRLRTAVEELSHLGEFHYVVVNREDRLDETAGEIAAIIAAEKLRTDKAKIAL